MSIDFYGSGITYPLQIGTRGGIHQSTGVQKVEESISHYPGHAVW